MAASRFRRVPKRAACASGFSVHVADPWPFGVPSTFSPSVYRIRYIVKSKELPYSAQKRSCNRRPITTPFTSGGDRIRTCDLEVMSLASYLAAPPRVRSSIITPKTARRQGPAGRATPWHADLARWEPRPPGRTAALANPLRPARFVRLPADSPPTARLLLSRRTDTVTNRVEHPR